MTVLIVSVCKEKLHEKEFVDPICKVVLNSGENILARHYSGISEEDLIKSDRIILCGTSLKDFEYFNNMERFSWILRLNKPILGICAGMQIIFSLFGGEILEKSKKISTNEEIGLENCKFNKDFLGLIGNCKVYELHQLGVKIGKSNFEPYAFSNEGLQAAKHKDNPIYCCLFHPEVRNQEVIRRFLKI